MFNRSLTAARAMSSEQFGIVGEAAPSNSAAPRWHFPFSDLDTQLPSDAGEKQLTTNATSLRSSLQGERNCLSWLIAGCPDCGRTRDLYNI